MTTTQLLALLDELKAKREKATPGEWTLCRDKEGEAEAVDGGELTGCDYDDEPYSTICRLPVEKYGRGAAWASEGNGLYIAAHSPAAMSRLDGLVRAALSELLELRERVRDNQGIVS
jgi:hypothetical protein